LVGGVDEAALALVGVAFVRILSLRWGRGQGEAVEAGKLLSRSEGLSRLGRGWGRVLLSALRIDMLESAGARDKAALFDAVSGRRRWRKTCGHGKLILIRMHACSPLINPQSRGIWGAKSSGIPHP
jgi:hypothetical protein